MKILVVYYSMYGHVHQMAQAVAEGAAGVDGAQVKLRRVPETLYDEVREKMAATESQQAQSQVPIAGVDDLAAADAILFGTPTRFGNMCGQMRSDEITGCSPYGASTIAGARGERMPSENELQGVRFQGRHVTTLAAQLAS